MNIDLYYFFRVGGVLTNGDILVDIINLIILMMLLVIVIINDCEMLHAFMITIIVVSE